MITHDGMSEILYYRKLKSMGLNAEYISDLPEEYQKAIVMAGISDAYENRKKRENFQKRMALKQYDFEEKVKEKVLTLLKKKR